MTAVATCPRCGASTEVGVFGAESYLGGAKWYKERSTLALGGEKIMAPSMNAMVWIDGARCRACRLLLLDY